MMRNIILTIAILVCGCEIIDPPTTEELKARVQRLKDADALVEEWANKLHAERDEEGGYKRYEGVTEIDPWGNFISVSYFRGLQYETLTVQSSGPDGTMNVSEDNLKRHRKIKHPVDLMATFSSPYSIITECWLAMGFAAFFIHLGVISKRKKRDVHHSCRYPTNVWGRIFGCLTCGPLAFLWVSFMFLGLTIVNGFDLKTTFFDVGLGDLG